MSHSLHEQVVETILNLTLKEYALIAFAVPVLLFIYRTTLHPLAGFPGPKLAAFSSFYYLYWINQGRLPQHLDTLYKKYNTNVIRIGPGQLVWRTPTAYKDIATAKEAYRGPFNFQLVGLTSKNLSNVKDPQVHRRKRKIMNLGFSAGTLATQEPTLIVPIVDKLIKRLTEVQGKVINLGDYMDCVTTDVIGKLAFGGDFHMLDELEKHSFLHILPRALKMSIIAQALPPFYKFLNVVYAYGPKFIIPKSLRAVADFADFQMKSRSERDAEVKDGEKQHDIMSIVTEGIEASKDPELYMDQRELLGEATTLVAGGGDTAASTCAIVMWHTVTHPEFMKEIQGQLRDKFTSSDEITSKIIQTDIPLVDAAIHEAMRLTPVTPGPLWRSIDKPMMIDGKLIPGNTNVGAARLSIWNDERLFHKAKEFIPHRWTDNMGDHLEAFQPWGLGARTCIGRAMAMVEMRLIIAKMLWTFDWEVITKTFDNPEFAVMYRVPLIMKPIARKA